MEIKFKSEDLLHLTISPSSKSWSILIGILSIGIGAAYYSPDEHVLLKLGYLAGCLFLGLTLLDDWEDCVFDRKKKLITLTRKSWIDALLSKCADAKTLLLDSNSVVEVNVVAGNKDKSQYGVVLILQSGGSISVSETTTGNKSNQESIAKCIRRVLCLDHVEILRENYDDNEEDTQSVSSSMQVESLRSNFIMEFEHKTDEGTPVLFEDTDNNDRINVADVIQENFDIPT